VIGVLSYNHWKKIPYRETILAGAVVILTGLAFVINISLNQALALICCLTIFTAWLYDKQFAVILALTFDMVKPLLIRISFAFDFNQNASSGFDLLGIAPTLILVVLILSEFCRRYIAGEQIFPDTPRQLLLVFTIIAFLSIFNPANSVLVGLGGFQRNIFPNMLILLLTASIFKTWDDFQKLMKAFLVVGIISIIYGLCQYATGVLPWEKDWMLNVAFKEDVGGWMTIGMRGIEFRIYSFFYSYAAFFYINVLIFSLLLASGNTFSHRWLKLRNLYFSLWIITLFISLERMAFIMTAVSFVTISYLKGSLRKRKFIVWAMASCFIIVYGGLKIAAPFLARTGVEKLIRLAELADPLNATSMNVRRDEIWAPAIAIIASHPLGVGIGFGSATKVSALTPKWSVNVQPHNELLQKAMETGIIGAFVFLFLIISLLKTFLKLSKNKYPCSVVGVGMTAATVAFCLCGMLNLTFSGDQGLVFWAMAGVSLAIKDQYRQDNKMAKPSENKTDIQNSHLVQTETFSF
jgi:O-antigen ligase